jgi:hypothetical protein
MRTADIRHIPWNGAAGRGFLRGAVARASTDVAVVIGWLRRARCAAGGHMMLRRFEPQRVSLECVGCGKRTPGWSLERV